jgi:hypothetical protein
MSFCAPQPATATASGEDNTEKPKEENTYMHD